MRILLVEDRLELRKTYSDIINDYNLSFNRQIELIDVNSIEELTVQLLTNVFDGAIIDNNLELWKTGNQPFTNLGFEICESINKISRFNDISSQVILYSVRQMEFKSAPFKILSKFIGPEALDNFEKEILESISSNINIIETSFDKFKEYSTSHKISYYKKHLLSKINSEERFKNYAPSISWSSDLTNRDKETMIGTFLNGSDKKPLRSININYHELDALISAHDKIPTLIWNFSDLNYFQKQDLHIRSQRFKNDFVKLFYSTSYAISLAKYILDKWDIVENLDAIIQIDDFIVLRETQCQIIERMCKENEKEPKIRSCLGELKAKLGLEIIDYFNGTLESYEEESDISTVRLDSIIDPKRYYYTKMSYKRLKANGIRYKEAEFNYCISEFQNSVNSYIEPK